jgi:Ni/Fe-hydrogenase subunit HybB-like protein
MPKINWKEVGFWPGVFGVLCILLGVMVVLRFTGGLGAISNLNDNMPWGLWIGFDMLCGVALAAGGFTITGVVYMFHLEKYRPIVRPTILTAFLGYMMVICALLLDLGRPWNIWHPIIFWNPHSVMFEIGWCVMLYTTVLFLEFLPMVFERFGYTKGIHIWHRLSPILVLMGILLSTLHQSSLGTLYVIVPQKMHPLWYSPILPILFFISAIALGLAMVCIESFLSLRAFGKHLEADILAQIGKACAVVLMLYLVVRIEDLQIRGSLPYAWKFDTASWFFLGEIGLGVVVPLAMLLFDKVRRRPLMLVFASFLVVLGMIFNRLNVGVTSIQLQMNVQYTPSWKEFAVSLGIIGFGFALFGLAVRYLPVFPEGPMDKPKPADPYMELAPKA